MVISICDAHRQKAEVRKTSGRKGTLFLQFDDAEPAKEVTLPPEIRLMTPQDADTIWAFVREYSREVGTIVVQCEQGVSRSPAVAAAICRGMAGDDQRFWREYQPNRYVFELVLARRQGGFGDREINLCGSLPDLQGVWGVCSMEQIILDLTDLGAAAAPGDEVTVVFWDPAQSNALDQMADKIGTIGYELATHLGSRLRRVVVP